MVKRSKVREHEGRASDVEMLKAMKEVQETMAGTLAGAASLAAGQGDGLTEDLCIARALVHENCMDDAHPPASVAQHSVHEPVPHGGRSWYAVGMCQTPCVLRLFRGILTAVFAPWSQASAAMVLMFEPAYLDVRAGRQGEGWAAFANAAHGCSVIRIISSG